MSDYYQELDKLAMGFGPDLFAPIPRKERAFKPLGPFNAESPSGSSRDIEGFSQISFDAPNFDFGFPALSPMPGDTGIVEPPNFHATSVDGLTFPLDLSGTPFDAAFGIDASFPFQDTPSAVGNGYVYEMPNANANGSGPFDQFQNSLQLPPLIFASYPSSISSTPELLTPGSSTMSLSPSPLQEHLSFASLLDPQPSLAGPSACTEFGRIEELSVPVKGECKTPALADIPATNDGTSVSRSPSPVLPDAFFVQRPSSAGPSRRVTAPPKVRCTPISRTKRCRRGCSSDGEKTGVPCTWPGCNERFFDDKTLDRHIDTQHDRENYERWYCPGCGRKEGFARDDSLLRHLRNRPITSECQIEARKLGWHPKVKGSIKKLRCVGPPN